MTSTSATNMLLLKSSDGLLFEVNEAAAQQSKTIRHMIEDGCADTTIPVDNVTSEILTKVLEYCKNHADDKVPEDNVAEKMGKLKIDEKKPNPFGEKKELTDAEKELKKFDDEFIDVDTDTLYDLIMAANFLDITSLLDLATQKVVDIMKGKNPEEIRQIFGIENDLTEEEKEQVERENAWAFEN